jgi:hypothetical protein
MCVWGSHPHTRITTTTIITARKSQQFHKRPDTLATRAPSPRPSPPTRFRPPFRPRIDDAFLKHNGPKIFSKMPKRLIGKHKQGTFKAHGFDDCSIRKRTFTLQDGTETNVYEYFM